MGRESEPFLLSGLSSKLFIVRVEDERKERRKKAVKWGLWEKRGQGGGVRKDRTGLCSDKNKIYN